MSIAKKSLIGSLAISAIAILTTAITIAALSYSTADDVIREQSKDRLVALREVQKEELTIYLDRIHKQILTMSDSLMMRQASGEFIAAFTNFAPVSQPSVAQMRDELQSYYDEQYGKLYREKNNGERANTRRLLDGISDKAIAFQYHFIQDNPNPLGSKDALDKLPFDDRYSDVHAMYHPSIRRYLQEFAYYDIFVIDAETGQIIYSVFKELDYATSLLDGPYRRSGLAEVFKEVRYATNPDTIAYSSFKSYTPSYEDPAAFIASPISNEQGETKAILAFQMPIDEFNKMMTHDQRWSEKGLGRTGETYLVGEDYKAQSLSRFLIEDKENYIQALVNANVKTDLIDTIAGKDTNIGFQEIRTTGVEAALAGESGFATFKNYRGVSVLSAYSYLDFEGSRLAIMIETDEEEAFAFQSQMISSNILATAIVSLLALLGVAVIVWRYTNKLSTQLNNAVDIADTVSRGDKADIVLDGRNDEIGALMAALNRMQNELIGELERREKDATRIKLALDVCDTSVMMADNDCQIIYMNESMGTTMEAAESDLRQELTHFSARELMGQNIDIFHKVPSHQRNLLSNLTESYRTRIEVGGRTFSLVATPIFGSDQERLGTVVEWEDLTEKLARELEEKREAADNARIKTALDSVSANVMMADADRNIIYMNEAVVATLSAAQEDIRTDLPNFSVDKLMGNTIDQFHKDSSHQMKILDSLEGTHDGKIIVGGRHMDLTVNPVRDAEGQRIGTVVEWADRTAEVAIQKEIDHIVASANDGNLEERISLEGKQGAFLSLSTGLNQLMDGIASFVGDMGKMFAAMSEGDLSETIQTDYRGQFEEIKNNANNTIAKLTQVMHKIQGASSAVRTSANEVAQGSDDLSRRTESQASSLEETASSMEEITATVKLTSDNAGQANTLAAEARSKAEAGGEVVQDAVGAMSEILESSNKINDIIGVIDEIAFQTNLLALNAAVEAARAGEQGRGFAVVAGEVRTLSQRSAAAAKEIKDLIRDSVSKVESGSHLVNQSGETLADIVSAVEKVAVMIQDVNNAALEQNSGIGQVNQAISQMDAMTQQNAALVEQTSAASRSMSEEATSMANLISFFRLSAGAGRVATPVTTPVTAPVTRAPAQAGAQNRESSSPPPAAPPQGSSSPRSGGDDDPVSSYIDDIYR